MNDFLIKTVENELKNLGLLKIHKKSDKNFDFEAILIYEFKENVYTKYLYTNYKNQPNLKDWLRNRVVEELSMGRLQIERIMYGEKFKNDHNRKVYNTIRRQLQNICIVSKGKDMFADAFNSASRDRLLEVCDIDPLSLLRHCKNRLKDEGIALGY